MVYQLYRSLITGGRTLPLLDAPHSGLNEEASALAETAHMQRNPAMFRSTCEYAIQMAANELLHLKGVSEAPVTVTTAMATATESLRDMHWLPCLDRIVVLMPANTSVRKVHPFDPGDAAVISR